MRLPTCHDGVKNCDKVYFPKVNTVFYKEEVRAAEEILNLTIEKNNIMAFCFSCTSQLSCGTQIAKRKWESLQPCILNRQQSVLDDRSGL